MSREEEAKLSSVLASRAPTVKEPFVFDDYYDGDDDDDVSISGHRQSKNLLFLIKKMIRQRAMIL